jgi:hypothetical protein
MFILALYGSILPTDIKGVLVSKAWCVNVETIQLSKRINWQCWTVVDLKSESKVRSHTCRLGLKARVSVTESSGGTPLTRTILHRNCENDSVALCGR